MHTTDLTGEDEDPGMLLQGPVSVAVDRASKAHALVAHRLQSFQIAGIVAVVSYHHQRPVSTDLAPTAQDQVRIVLRLQTANVKDVPAWLQVQAVEVVIPRRHL